MQVISVSGLRRAAVAWVLCCTVAFADAQAISSSSPDRDAINAYRFLFRRNISYNKLADQADAVHQPKPHLRHVLANRFGLSADDAASLDRLSLAYKKEIDPIHAEVVEALQQFHARFPGGVILPGTDRTLPPGIVQLQQQEDAVVLRYRDLLRNSMRGAEFQSFQGKLLADLQALTTAPSPGGNQ